MSDDIEKMFWNVLAILKDKKKTPEETVVFNNAIALLKKHEKDKNTKNSMREK